MRSLKLGFLLCLITSSLTVATENPYVVISYDRSMSMFRNFLGAPEQDQMNVEDFIRINKFLFTFFDSGYDTAIKELKTSDVPLQYFEHFTFPEQEIQVQMLKHQGITDDHIYYFDYGAEISNDRLYPLDELRTMLMGSVPDAPNNGKYSQHKAAFKTAFPHVKTDIPCSVTRVYEQYTHGKPILWINISDNQVSLVSGSGCLPEVIRYEHKFIQHTIFDIGINDYVHIAASIVQPIVGCTDPDAANFQPYALVEDGSCIFSPGDFIAAVHGDDIVWPVPSGTPPFIFSIDDQIVESPFSPEKNGTYTITATNCWGSTYSTVEIDDLPEPEMATTAAPQWRSSLILMFILLFGSLGAAN